MQSFFALRRSPRLQRSLCALSTTLLDLAFAGHSLADPHAAGTPQLSSDPGASYTLYLDFSGFSYTGQWGTSTPGVTPAYDGVAANGTFSTSDVSDITNTWAIVAQQYAGFNINVTTVDPAIAAGQAGTDLARQTYYGNTANLQHTVIGSQNRNGTNWYNNTSGGVSFVGVTTGTDTSANGADHTTWVFSGDATSSAVGNYQFLGGTTAHENGHALGLSHQSDYSGNTLINEYTSGDTNSDVGNPPDPSVVKGLRGNIVSGPFVGPIAPRGTSPSGILTGPGTYSATMGDSNFGTQRLAFRVGDADTGTAGHFQNDVGTILSTNTAANATAQGRTGGVDLHFKADGIGHSMLAATTLPLTGSSVNFSLATGVITPITENGPTPTGASNYTSDFFRFTLSATSAITLTAHDGTQFLTPGVADFGATLRSTLSILNAAGMVIAIATEDASTLFETYSGSLAAGTYSAEINSFGGHNQVNPAANNYNASTYYDMGGYFLTGSGFNAVPEPGTWALLGLGGAGLLTLTLRQRRLRAA